MNREQIIDKLVADARAEWLADREQVADSYATAMRRYYEALGDDDLAALAQDTAAVA